MKKILITGAKGFLGSNLSNHFNNLGYETFGVGHRSSSSKKEKELSMKYWIDGDITKKSILELDNKYDVIIHCGGSGSVGYSMNHVKDDFKKTVDSTKEVLEFMREYNPSAHLIYPSSPAVQGEHPDQPIKEEYVGEPTSPYGYHKRIVEDLCLQYSEEFGLNISVVRLFSIYGNGLKKQLLWDACKKISNSQDEAVFWGTGKETRDFIHVTDVIRLFELLLEKKDKFLILNGGTGQKYTVQKVVEMIRDLIDSNIEITFNNQSNKGNPPYYWADTKKLEEIGFKTNKILHDELKNYVKWAVSLND